MCVDFVDCSLYRTVRSKWAAISRIVASYEDGDSSDDELNPDGETNSPQNKNTNSNSTNGESSMGSRTLRAEIFTVSKLDLHDSDSVTRSLTEGCVLILFLLVPSSYDVEAHVLLLLLLLLFRVPADRSGCYQFDVIVCCNVRRP